MITAPRIGRKERRSPKMELSERKLKVLQAIISDYVRTAEPVGSRTLSKKPELDYSPATIRNEMADLEEMGYLTHPHTSAGRVPSDKAYRLYVNALMEKKELSKEEKNIIADRLRGRVNDFEKTIEYAFGDNESDIFCADTEQGRRCFEIHQSPSGG